MEPFADVIRASHLPPSLRRRVLGEWGEMDSSAPRNATGCPQPHTGGQIPARGSRYDPGGGAADPTQRNGAGRIEAVRSGGWMVPAGAEAAIGSLVRAWPRVLFRGSPISCILLLYKGLLYFLCYTRRQSNAAEPNPRPRSTQGPPAAEDADGRRHSHHRDTSRQIRPRAPGHPHRTTSTRDSGTHSARQTRTTLGHGTRTTTTYSTTTTATPETGTTAIHQISTAAEPEIAATPVYSIPTTAVHQIRTTAAERNGATSSQEPS